MTTKEQKEKEPIKISLFRPLINVAFGEFMKWKVVGDPKSLVISKKHMTGELFINEKQLMHFLKYNKNGTQITFKASQVDTIMVTKDTISVIGDFDGNKKDDIAVQGDNAEASLRSHSSPNKK
jgi:hypothetical protein